MDYGKRKGGGEEREEHLCLSDLEQQLWRDDRRAGKSGQRQSNG